jgi:hypothetical protein
MSNEKRRIASWNKGRDKPYWYVDECMWYQTILNRIKYNFWYKHIVRNPAIQFFITCSKANKYRMIFIPVCFSTSSLWIDGIFNKPYLLKFVSLNDNQYSQMIYQLFINSVQIV